jgi:methanogenic corrinoid protein MtbC1/DNA-binding XRE family transcriptional regulator
MSQNYSVKPRENEIVKTRQELLDALISGDQLAATQVVDNLVSQRWEPTFVYENTIGHCLVEIGARWHNGDLSIAIEHRATQIALRLLSRAQDVYAPTRRVGRRALVTSVEGDNHLIGGLAFADLLRFEGWEVDFLGADSPVSSIVDLVTQENPDLVGLSVTMEEYLPNATSTVKALKVINENLVVVVGGAAAVTSDAAIALAEADFYGTDAVAAVDWTQKKFGLNDSTMSLKVMLSDLGSTIQSLRKDRGLSQQQLAMGAGLDRSYISAVENGKQNVSFATLKGISDVLGVRVTELISGRP